MSTRITDSSDESNNSWLDNKKKTKTQHSLGQTKVKINISQKLASDNLEQRILLTLLKGVHSVQLYNVHCPLQESSSSCMRGSLPSTDSSLVGTFPPPRSLLMSATVSGKGLPKVSGSFKFARPAARLSIPNTVN